MLALVVLTGVILPAGADPALPVLPDAWSPPITFRNPDGTYAAPWHAALLPDGRVLFIGVKRPTFEPPPTNDAVAVTPSAFVITPSPDAPPSREVIVGPLAQPVAAAGLRMGDVTVYDSLDCSGTGLLADGRFLTVGGARVLSPDGGSRTILGLSTATIFDGATWTRLEAETVAPGRTGLTGRWYPTVTKLANGRMLVTGGFDEVGPDALPNLSTEVFDPATGRFTVDAAFGQAPFDIYASDYPHVFTLPYAGAPSDVMVIGEPGVPTLHRVGEATAWDVTGLPRPGSRPDEFPNHGTTAAMLPLRQSNGSWGYANGSVVVTGGAHGTAHLHSGAVFDPVQRTWSAPFDLQVNRHHGTTVLLPDSRVLLVAGHDDQDDGVRRAQYLDPAAGMAVSIGAGDGGEVRGYHNVALLLPDGRVLVGGGRDRDTSTSGEKASFRYYSPWYLSKPRPRITTATTNLGFGAPFTVTTQGPAAREFVLMGLGSVTHSFDMNQRSVQLRVSSTRKSGSGLVSTVVAPPDGAVAPPGHYMLFAVGADRVPSEAKIVRLG